MLNLPGQKTPTKRVESLIKICRLAWDKGLMPGFSGNASLRLHNDNMLITRSGTGKGLLKHSDLLVIDFQGNILAGYGKPSSEWRMHAALYGACGGCRAILHTHPACLQSVDMLLAENENFENLFLNLPLFEAGIWKARLRFAPACPPGSSELAQKCITSGKLPSELPNGVWMRQHGLTVLGASLEEALCLTEELEHLGRLQLNLLTHQALGA